MAESRWDVTGSLREAGVVRQREMQASEMWKVPRGDGSEMVLVGKNGEVQTGNWWENEPSRDVQVCVSGNGMEVEIREGVWGERRVGIMCVDEYDD